MEVIILSDNMQTRTPEGDKSAANVKKFSYFEPVTGIIIAIICTVIFLWFSQIITIAFNLDPPSLIPTFNVDIIHSLWLPVLLWGLVRIGGNVAYLIERIYTKRLAIITLVGNALTIILTIIIFASHRIVNPEHARYMRDLFESTAAWFGEILANPNAIILVIIIFVMMLDTITVVRKRKKRQEIEEKEEAGGAVREV